jgi:hypothetical protein
MVAGAKLEPSGLTCHVLVMEKEGPAWNSRSSGVQSTLLHSFGVFVKNGRILPENRFFWLISS